MGSLVGTGFSEVSVGAAVAAGAGVCVFRTGTGVNVDVDTAGSDGMAVVAGIQETVRVTRKKGTMSFIFTGCLLLQGTAQRLAFASPVDSYRQAECR